ncbi:unnamed protein product [Laminaria digitata]
MDDAVLRTACDELKTNMQATLKETDIFKVYQTGDLANMDGLPEESKRLLPSLFAIRDGLYSLEFRRLVQSLTGSGPLSGEQIDLSANAFGHTGHLLCHDDVIGTRKVSYILYLVDKDWGSGEKPDGGGLQLYPLETDGVPGIPAYAPSKTIPPRWNQMVLFAVQPGVSFHDVQEVYNEHKPRLAVSGWFHAALPSEMGDWPDHKLDGDGDGSVDPEGDNAGATSTLEQLKGAAGDGVGGVSGGDGSDCDAFTDDFEGAQGLKELAEWVNPEYLAPSMAEQCAAAFTENGSTIQLHRFLKDDIAEKIVDAAIAADRADGLGYMEASPFDAGVRGGWRKAGPPHRQRMLRLSATDPGTIVFLGFTDGDGPEEKDDEIGALLRELRDKLFRGQAFRAFLQKMLGDASVVASRRQARRFRPGLDYTLATPGAPWKLKRGAKGGGGGGAGGDTGVEDRAPPNGGGEEEQYMVLDVVLCFVDDREPYKEAAWKQDEVGGYVTYLGGDDDDEEAKQDDNPVPPQEGKGDGSSSSGGNSSSGGSSSGGSGNKQNETAAASSSSSGTPVDKQGGEKNDAAVYKADEGGSLVSVSAASNALSLVLRDDAGIASFVKYLSSAAPGSRFDVMGEYLVVGGGSDDDDEDDYDDDSDSSEGVGGLAGARAMLETVPEEGESGEEEEDEEEEEETEEGEEEAERRDEGSGESGDERRRKKMRPI